jgi:hypothetical protein
MKKILISFILFTGLTGCVFSQGFQPKGYSFDKVNADAVSSTFTRINAYTQIVDTFVCTSSFSSKAGDFNERLTVKGEAVLSGCTVHAKIFQFDDYTGSFYADQFELRPISARTTYLEFFDENGNRRFYLIPAYSTPADRRSLTIKNEGYKPDDAVYIESNWFAVSPNRNTNAEHYLVMISSGGWFKDIADGSTPHFYRKGLECSTSVYAPTGVFNEIVWADGSRSTSSTGGGGGGFPNPANAPLNMNNYCILNASMVYIISASTTNPTNAGVFPFENYGIVMIPPYADTTNNYATSGLTFIKDPTRSLTSGTAGLYLFGTGTNDANIGMSVQNMMRFRLNGYGDFHFVISSWVSGAYAEYKIEDDNNNPYFIIHYSTMNNSYIAENYVPFYVNSGTASYRNHPTYFSGLQLADKQYVDDTINQSSGNYVTYDGTSKTSVTGGTVTVRGAPAGDFVVAGSTFMIKQGRVGQGVVPSRTYGFYDMLYPDLVAQKTLLSLRSGVDIMNDEQSIDFYVNTTRKIARISGYEDDYVNGSGGLKFYIGVGGSYANGLDLNSDASVNFYGRALADYGMRTTTITFVDGTQLTSTAPIGIAIAQNTQNITLISGTTLYLYQQIQSTRIACVQGDNDLYQQIQSTRIACVQADNTIQNTLNNLAVTTPTFITKGSSPTVNGLTNLGKTVFWNTWIDGTTGKEYSIRFSTGYLTMRISSNPAVGDYDYQPVGSSVTLQYIKATCLSKPSGGNVYFSAKTKSGNSIINGTLQINDGTDVGVALSTTTIAMDDNVVIKCESITATTAGADYGFILYGYKQRGQ